MRVNCEVSLLSTNKCPAQQIIILLCERIITPNTSAL